MEKKRTIFYLIMILPPGVVLFLFGYLGSFTRFIADDYCSAYYAREFGLIDSILYWYRTWSGRYSAFGTDWVILNLFDANHIWFFPPLFLLLWIGGSIFAIYYALSREDKHLEGKLWKASLLGVTGLYSVMILSPNIPQSFYWWNGFRSYTLPLIVLTSIFLFFFALRDRFYRRRDLIIGSLLSAVLFFASGGLSETYVVMQFALLFVLSFFHWFSLGKIHTDKETLFLASGIVGTVLSLSVILHSHGNELRREVMPPAPSLMTLMEVSFKSLRVFLGEWIQSTPKMLAIGGSILSAVWVGKTYKNSVVKKGKKSGRLFNAHSLAKVPLSLFAAFLLLFASFLPGVYGYVKFPPTRTLIVGVFMFVIFWLQAGFLLGSWLAQHRAFRYQGKTLILLAILFIAFSSFTTAKSLYASRHIYIDFAEKWDRVDAEILEAKAAGAPSITTEGMDNWAGLDRPNENPKWWPTRCYSLYYDFLVMGPPYGN